MKHVLTSPAAGLVLATEPASAQGYQVYCAILLSLAGGPASLCALCPHAGDFHPHNHTLVGRAAASDLALPNGRPVQRPCPLSPIERLYDIAFRAGTETSFPDATVPLVLVQADGRADIDISGSAFDCVRSTGACHRLAARIAFKTWATHPQE